MQWVTYEPPALRTVHIRLPAVGENCSCLIDISLMPLRQDGQMRNVFCITILRNMHSHAPQNNMLTPNYVTSILCFFD